VGKAVVDGLAFLPFFVSVSLIGIHRLGRGLVGKPSERPGRGRFLGPVGLTG
jgi:hypothetical protein